MLQAIYNDLPDRIGVFRDYLDTYYMEEPVIQQLPPRKPVHLRTDL